MTYAAYPAGSGDRNNRTGRALKNTEKRYRFFTIDRLVKAGGAVYNEKNFDDLNGASS